MRGRASSLKPEGKIDLQNDADGCPGPNRSSIWGRRIHGEEQTRKTAPISLDFVKNKKRSFIALKKT